MKQLLCVFIALVIVCMGVSVQSADLDLDLSMPSHYFIPGNVCALDLSVSNIGSAHNGVAAFVALDIGVGAYWFSPSWSNMDFHSINVPASGSTAVTVLPEFIWPDGVGSFLGASFIAAATDAKGTLISDVDIYTFGWLDGPAVSEMLPAAAAPGRTIWVYGMGFGGDHLDIYATFGDIPVPAMSLEHYDNGVDLATFVVPIMDPGPVSMTVTVADEVSNATSFTIQPLPDTGVPHGDVVDSIVTGMDAFVGVFKSDILEGAIARGDISGSRRQEYYSAVDRASSIIYAFTAEWAKLPMAEQKLFEQLLVEAGIYQQLITMEKTVKSFSGTNHANDMAFYLMVDATSACLTAIDIAWSAIDVAAAVAAISSGGVAIALPAVAGGIQLGIKIADKALDGFVTSDLDSFGIQDGSMGDQYVEVELDKTENAVLYGKFKAQMTWQKATFTAVIDVMLFGLFEKLPFSEAAKDQAIKSILNFVTGILNNIGISLTEDIMSLNGPPAESVVTIDYDVMKQIGIQQALSMTNFGAGILNGPIGLYLYLTETYPGYEVQDSSIAKVTFSGENIMIEGKKAGITQLSIRGVRFVSTNFLYIFSPEIFSKVETRFNIEVKQEELELYADGMLGCEGKDAALFFSGIELILSGSDYYFIGSGAGTDYDGDALYFIVDGRFSTNPLKATVDIAIYSDPSFTTHSRTDRAEAYPVYQDWFYDSACTLIDDTTAGCVPIWLGIRFKATRNGAGDEEIFYFNTQQNQFSSGATNCTLTR